MIIVPPGEVHFPRYIESLVQLSLTSDRWGADILLRSKEFATMNTGTQERYVGRLITINILNKSKLGIHKHISKLHANINNRIDNPIPSRRYKGQILLLYGF